MSAVDPVLIDYCLLFLYSIPFHTFSLCPPPPQSTLGVTSPAVPSPSPPKPALLRVSVWPLLPLIGAATPPGTATLALGGPRVPLKLTWPWLEGRRGWRGKVRRVEWLVGGGTRVVANVSVVIVADV